MEINLPDEIILKSGCTAAEVRQFLAMALYKAGKLDSRSAGSLCNLEELDFYRLLKESGMTLNYDVDDLEDDVRQMRNSDV